MYGDDNFEKMRLEVLQHSIDRNKKLIETWCSKAGVNEPVGYYNDMHSHVMKIYTNRPGYLIGKAGCLVDGFKEKLKEEFGKDYTVEFIEIRGSIVNVKIR